ncbi:acid-sensing ion channel 1C-like isoform X4 [Branchiostoma floridae]|uniref:Acid-sensing ion channel 1C-like isoform X4 n=1 Tax=Branchiostoma floridae TaxID=7739 RepID=A0A9J7HVD7_BRAFL|nr:acid-sensing ion channel 1C-like isoform X4 [Branchiostoma floridae]XP_035665146.1 acid-sensing ion channel 1C-like isoform X4 [Branchiostoma floridae]
MSSYEDNEPKPSDINVFAGNATMHGISHIFTEGSFSFRRFLWAAAFLVCFGMVSYNGYDRVMYYLSYPRVTKLDELEAQMMNFPAITMCNLNPFRFSKVTKDDLWQVGHALEILDENKKLAHSEFVDPEHLSTLRRLAEFGPGYVPKDKDSFSMKEFYNRTAHQIQDMVLECSYRGTKCSWANFTVVFTRYGKCYTFNSGSPNQPVLKTLKGGIGNGVEFFLDVQQEDYMPAWGESDEVTFEVGFKIQLHTQEEPPFIHELGFGVGPGMQYYVSTQEQRITYLPAPWGQCKAENDLTFDFAKYTTSACRIDCETKFVVSQCGCKMVHMPGNFPICTPDVYVECADQALDFLVKSDNKKCVCDTPCNTTRYNLFMSHVKFPSEQAVKYLARKYGKPEDYFRKNTLVLNVFFEALNYETIEQQKAYEVASLLGDIGGQMGLFIGASILTILELFDYLYEVLKDKCTERRHQPRSESNAVSVNLEDCKRDNSRAPLS